MNNSDELLYTPVKLRETKKRIVQRLEQKEQERKILSPKKRTFFQALKDFFTV